MNISSENLDDHQIIKYLKNLEARISRIEAALKLEPLEKEPEMEPPPPVPGGVSEKADTLELHIGEFWLAKAGILVLAVGIAFLLTLPYQNLPPILPSLIGYLLVAGIFTLAHYWRESFFYLSRYLIGGGMVLLYFTTMRLHFFSARPAVAERYPELLLLLAVVVINLGISVRRKSIYLSALSLAMAYITALVSDQSYLIFTLLTVISALVVYLKLTYRWHPLLVYGIILTYLTHFLWFLNNPFLGNKIQLVSSPEANLFFILTYVLIFAFGNLFRGKDLPEDNILILSTFLNCLGGYGLYLLLTLGMFQGHLTAFHLLASALFLILSIAFWIREKSRYSTFFYAMLGYSALSVAIIAHFGEPDSIVWLSWQSIVVITTAIWFRSKFIIVANFLIYVLIFLAYITVVEEISAISLGFGFVALLSARILNWQKHRLELKTELMRNAYLASAFFVFPYTLYHLLPGSYVSISWVAVTLFYYLLSRLLDNKKYRWMALGTLLLTVLRVFIVDTTGVEALYRVATFLVVGIALLVLSLIYTGARKKAAGGKEKRPNNQ